MLPGHPTLAAGVIGELGCDGTSVESDAFSGRPSGDSMEEPSSNKLAVFFPVARIECAA
ncbi:hypothetical protein TBK1r_25690 [Stieleria magnilauensis]|uniref:Uncharacterized protein n=1 Tax=Stieleria magnilauensis TaxID=2527963 RepID=A0ABX5XPQ0_9BACT|nr:hypothetical protein TBK1r_25690 [Planctomycetes bacterium TBK1r]